MCSSDLIDVLQFKQAAIILKLLRTASDFPGRKIQVGLVEITNRHHFRIPMLEKSVEYLIPAISESDKPQADAIICAVNARGAERRRKARCNCLLAELSPR